MKYRALSMFAGCGGLDLGLKGGFSFREYQLPKTNFEIVCAIDFDADAVGVYNANKNYFGRHECIQRDVKDISKEEIPDYDVLLAGFPCQPFSNAGNREGVNDKNGRGTLFYECERFLLSKKNANGGMPKAFVFENVRGIMSSRMPNGNTIPEEIKKRTKEIGYNCTYRLLKASNFGVPQNRLRCIMIGVREDLPEFDFAALDEIVTKYNLPNSKNDPYELYLGSILCDIPASASHINDVWQYSPSGQRMIEMIGPCKDGAEKLKSFKAKVALDRISSTITEGRSWKNIPPHKMTPRFRKIYENPEKYRAPNFYRRFALGEINGTITASGQPENSGITHPYEHRRFSVREIARIQSFPDDFVFPVRSISGAYKVIGNAIPPVFGWVIAKALEKHLTSC